MSNENWTLHLGDCLDPATGMASLADKSVDAVITDPPYAITNEGMWHIGNPGKGKRRFDFFDGDEDWDSMRAIVNAAALQCLRVGKNPGTAYWWCGHREFGDLVDIYEKAGFSTRFMVWAKLAPSPPPPGSGWPSGAELCVYAFEPGRVWNHDGKDLPPNNVIRCDSYRHGQPGKVDHPTQKPEELLVPILRASTRPGDLILDPFAGSGTTGVAALKMGRRFIGWERDPKYHAIAVKRLTAAREQLELAV